MQRIMVIGCSGAGKSWLSARIARALDLPLVSLDAEYWQPNWTQPEHLAWIHRVKTLAAQEKWVMDGNYAGTLEIRMPRADAVIFLDLPRWRCMLSLIFRTFAHWGNVREGMAKDCPERMDLEFFRHAWRCRSVIRDATLKAMAALRADQTGVILQSRAEIGEFAGGLTCSLSKAERSNAPL